MDLGDLRIFLAATRHPSLHAAAAELHLTASALSKAIRRLEAALRTPLFDRVGKSLVINAAGDRLRQRASDLLHLAEQTRAEFAGDGFRVHCRIAAPAVLQWRHAGPFADALTALYPVSSLEFRPAYENEAWAALERGEVDFALVTGEALQPGRMLRARDAPQAVALGSALLQLAAAADHPLARAAAAGQPIDTARMLQYDFACPTRSVFCGVERGAQSDGWRDPQAARRIRYWVDDVLVLVDLVRSGRALAYLPDFVVERQGLAAIAVADSAYACHETVHLLWRPTAASGWQARLVERMGEVQDANERLGLPEPRPSFPRKRESSGSEHAGRRKRTGLPLSRD